MPLRKLPSGCSSRTKRRVAAIRFTVKPSLDNAKSPASVYAVRGFFDVREI
jgi:hypothetical protein